MCGITGFFDPCFSLQTDAYCQIISRMSDTLYHRGPDDSGIWLDKSKGIGFGFRRLAILDLSPAGHQPMESANEQYVIIFNGEVYNYDEIRQELLTHGHTFRGTCDTEVMLAAISEWGVEKSLNRFNGMFAFALWNRKNCTLTLARDRLGIKPLYYGWINNVFLFGSELKSLEANPAFHAEINREALCLFLRHNYVPAPYSIFENIFKLFPGSYITLSGEAVNQQPVPHRYWSLFNTAQDGVDHPFRGNDLDAIDELDALLRDSIRLRMIADVPLGAFLSGGIDSSTIVALMQAQSPTPVKTFTIGFHEKLYNEADHARNVATYLGTDHTELFVSPDEARSVIPNLPTLYDEPFADSSQIPTFLVSKLTRQKVTVSLTGDGGDELFCGYNRYSRTNRIAQFTSFMNGSLANVGNQFLTTITSTRFKSFWEGLGGYSPGTNMQRTRFRIVTLAENLKRRPIEEIYFNYFSTWKDPEQIVMGGKEPATILQDKSMWPSFRNFEDTMMYLDTMTYLTDNNLAKVDRASMGVSLEARVPFLDDHRIIEFAWHLPLSLKIRRGRSKWILRQVLYRYVPPSLIERPKMGFGVPIDSWLRGSLRDWAETLLNETLLIQQGYFNPAPIRIKWAEHMSGQNNWQYLLWDILMFQSWLERRG
jgi:asparagine synthase (glutamine-hydrolysing)